MASGRRAQRMGSTVLFREFRMNRDRHQLSLRGKFNIAIALVYVVVALVTLGAFGWVTRGILMEFAQRIAVKQALLERNKIYSVIEREVALARTLARDPVVRRWVLAEDDAVCKAQALEQLENYRRLFRDQSYFIAIDTSKRYYINNGFKSGNRLETMVLKADNPSDRWYFRTMAAVDDYALNMDYDAFIQAAKVWFNVVIRDDAGRKIGVGGGGIDITGFIRDIVTPSEEGISAIVVDKDGFIQAHPDERIVEHNATVKDDSQKLTLFTQIREVESRQQLLQALYRLSAGVSQVEAFPVDMGHGLVLAAVSAIPEIGWFNVVLVDVSKVLSARVFWPLFVVNVLSLLLIIVTITMLTGAMVIRPLIRLTAASGEVAQGRYDIALPVTRKDEIGQLTASFNAMAAQVRQYTQNLEGLVRERTAELTAANAGLHESRQRIMESLRYARTIQRSILPKPHQMDLAFREHMVLYLPRDIVGGDLYYFQGFQNHVLFGVLDCTGHGVPGAFMAMTAHSVLNHVVGVICRDDPAVILRETDRVLRETLSLEDTGRDSVDCGLEIGLCLVRPSGQVVFAGAGLSLYVHSGGELREIKGDRTPLGYRGAFVGHVYTNHVVEAQPGTRFYATSDGLLDEGGGDKGYCFGVQRFREMANVYADQPMAAQAALFETVLAAYRGGRRQRDDITVIGFGV